MLCPTETDLFNAGQDFAKELTAHDIVCLHGVMGAGKTHFVKGCCSALGIDDYLVASPSYSLVHHYTGKFPIAHFDLYRLSDAHEFDLIGGHDLLEQCLCFIEWPDLILDELPKPFIKVSITIEANNARNIRIDNVV